MKMCTKCKLSFDESNFHKNAAKKDGLHNLCKPCAISHVKKYSVGNEAKKAEYDREYREKNLEKVRQRARDYAAKNAEAARIRVKEWALANPEKVKEQRRNDFLKNAEKRIKSLKDWVKANPVKVRANTAYRRAKKLSATPSWCNKAEVTSIYRRAKELGMHVDHIVPLRSKYVCGLHVPANLQLLTPQENFKKNNKYWPDMP
jgi:5-methylcytosine-specific restriction endonuclease McrA